MKKKKILIAITILLILSPLVGFIIYKKAILSLYDIETFHSNEYSSILKKLQNKNTVFIKHKEADSYLEYNDFKIRNDFSSWDITEDDVFNDGYNILVHLTLKDGSGKNVAQLNMGYYANAKDRNDGIYDNFYTMKSAYTTNGKEVQVNYSKLFDKYNIHDDVDLINFLKKDLDTSNIFTPVQKIKDNYFLAATAGYFSYNITIIEGDYRGYIMDNDYFREVHLIDNNHNFSLLFMNGDYFNENYVNEIISTIIIK